MITERRLKDEVTGAFDIRLRSLLKMGWQNLTTAEIIKVSVLSRLASEDKRIKRVRLTSDIKAEDEFLSEMRVFSYAKKRSAPSSNNSSAGPKTKRHKPSDSRIKCFYCGILGHKIAEYCKRIKFEKQKIYETQREIDQLHR